MNYREQDTSPLSELLIWLHFVLTPWIDGLKTPDFFLCLLLNLKNDFILVSHQQSSELPSSCLILIDKWGVGERKGNMKRQIHKINAFQQVSHYPKLFEQQQKLRHRFLSPHRMGTAGFDSLGASPSRPIRLASLIVKPALSQSLSLESFYSILQGSIGYLVYSLAPQNPVLIF